MRLPLNSNHSTNIHHQSGATFCFPVYREQSVPASNHQRVTGATPQRLTLDDSPTLQPLEPRLLLTAYVADDGLITLREAIEDAAPEPTHRSGDRSGGCGILIYGIPQPPKP